MTPDEAISTVFGSQAAMARAFGLTAPAVLRWRRAGRFPARRAYELEAAIARHQARQDAPAAPVEVTATTEGVA